MTSKPELMRSLSELRGKALGCLCQSPHSCHRHVLVELVMTAVSPEEDYCTKESKGNIYYFKGSFSPLSNFYLAVMVDSPPNTMQIAEEILVGVFSTLLLAEGSKCRGFENCARDMEGEIGEKCTTVEQENPHS